MGLAREREREREKERAEKINKNLFLILDNIFHEALRCLLAQFPWGQSYKCSTIVICTSGLNNFLEYYSIPSHKPFIRKVTGHLSILTQTTFTTGFDRFIPRKLVIIWGVYLYVGLHRVVLFTLKETIIIDPHIIHSTSSHPMEWARRCLSVWPDG